MSPIPGYFFGILSACAVFCVGRYLIAQPEKVARVFAFGQQSVCFSISFFRIVGRFYCWLSVIAMVMLLGATVAALFAR
jgi:hypothetical protein